MARVGPQSGSPPVPCFFLLYAPTCSFSKLRKSLPGFPSQHNRNWKLGGLSSPEGLWDLPACLGDLGTTKACTMSPIYGSLLEAYVGPFTQKSQGPQAHLLKWRYPHRAGARGWDLTASSYRMDTGAPTPSPSSLQHPPPLMPQRQPRSRLNATASMEEEKVPPASGPQAGPGSVPAMPQRPPAQNQERAERAGEYSVCEGVGVGCPMDRSPPGDLFLASGSVPCSCPYIGRHCWGKHS